MGTILTSPDGVEWTQRDSGTDKSLSGVAWGNPPSAAPPVVSALPGDVDGDGRVTVADATLALRAAVGLTPLTEVQVQAADVSPRPGTGGKEHGDGAVRIGDAIVILGMAVGSIKM
ncbi:MAG: dockerin type I repeat-containing protein [Armatimonadota bacterium]